jgi:hypothetical protein
VSAAAHADAAQQQGLECRHQLEHLHNLTKTLATDLTDTVQRCQQMHTESAVLMTRLSAAQHGLDNVKSLMLQQLHMSRRSSIDYGSCANVREAAAPAPAQPASSTAAVVPALKPSASTAVLPSMLAVPALPSPQGVDTPSDAEGAAASSAAATAPDEPSSGAATPAGTRDLHRSASESARDQTAVPSTSASRHSPAKPGSSRSGEPGTSAAPDTVLELNVRGTTVYTLRSTLALVPGSYLAELFCPAGHAAAAAASSEPVQLLRDAQGRPFLPYDPTCFAAVLDGLHELQLLGSAQPLVLPPAAQPKQHLLQALVQQLGLQQVLAVAGASMARSAFSAGGLDALASSGWGLGAVQISGVPAGPAPSGVRVPNMYTLMAGKGE